MNYRYMRLKELPYSELLAISNHVQSFISAHERQKQSGCSGFDYEYIQKLETIESGIATELENRLDDLYNSIL